MATRFQLDTDQAKGVDQEDRRRLRNQMRRIYRRQKRRIAWLTHIEKHEPKLYKELIELRARHAMGFRKELIAAAKRLGIWAPTLRCAPRDLPTPEDRGREPI